MKRLILLWFITVIALPLSELPAACIYAQEATAKTYAQKLVEDTLAKHPEVATLAIHATPPNGKENVIIASNFGRIGKKADADDLSVIKTGRPKMEVNKTGDRFSVELPLLDVGKNTIGALAVAFPYKSGDDKTKLQKQAELIQNHLSRRISHTANLFDPARFDDKTPENTYAQKLVEESMARHPDVIILVMHVTPPNDGENVILGSNIGRVGKKADEDDMRVIETGKPNLEVNTAGDRFEVELVLQDVGGNTIGALGVVFPYKAGDDKAKRQKQAEQIRDELRKQIPSAAKMFEPAQ
jgi:RNase H-fold protein (predicted Holliday junction resolvase)